MFRYTYNGSVFPPGLPDHIVCPNYWWRNILYVQTWFPFHQLCMLWSWYLANDMQFYIWAIVLLIFAKRYEQWKKFNEMCRVSTTNVPKWNCVSTQHENLFLLWITISHVEWQFNHFSLSFTFLPHFFFSLDLMGPDMPRQRWQLSQHFCWHRGLYRRWYRWNSIIHWKCPSRWSRLGSYTRNRGLALGRMSWVSTSLCEQCASVHVSATK